MSGIGPVDPDEALVERLRSIAAQVDPPPAHVDELARAAFSTRHVDELARILFDSAAEDAAPVRGAADETRVVTLAAEGVTAELELARSPDGLRLRGYVTGAEGDIVVESPRGRTRVALGDDGWFALDGPPVALLRIALTARDGRRVRTPWLDL